MSLSFLSGISIFFLKTVFLYLSKFFFYFFVQICHFCKKSNILDPVLLFHQEVSLTAKRSMCFGIHKNVLFWGSFTCVYKFPHATFEHGFFNEGIWQGYKMLVFQKLLIMGNGSFSGAKKHSKGLKLYFLMFRIFQKDKFRL